MLDERRLRRVLEIGSTVVSELDLEAVLHRVLEEARELTGARYAALGVLDANKERLERFITVGTSPQARQAIGDPPHGRGVLGLLIRDPKPLRVDDLAQDPRSYGFPPGHPPMRSFLGVPIVIRGEAYGNLYLTDKQGAGGFDADDEEATELLAGWAAIAIDNARAYTSEQQRRVELEQAVHALEATTAIARALGGETDLDRILELIVHRAQALLAARNVVLLLLENDELHVRASAGPLAQAVGDVRIPIEGSVGGEIVRSMRPRRMGEVRSHLRFALAERVEAEVALLVPLVFRGRALGVIEAFDRQDGAEFSADDEHLLASFAASAATAVATAQTAANEALRRSMHASERERSRWARELHDDTLQQLAGLKVLLSRARRQGSPQRLEQAVGLALDQLDDAIAELRRLIADLRPAALDDLGLADAVESLVDRVQRSSGLKTTVRIDIGDERLPRALEDNAYRIVQEALTNVVKHAEATRIAVTLLRADDTLHIRVVDDGSGLDPHVETGGFGLIGMRERVALASGTLTIGRGPSGGTAIDVRLPVGALADPAGGPGPDRAMEGTARDPAR